MAITLRRPWNLAKLLLKIAAKRCIVFVVVFQPGLPNREVSYTEYAQNPLKLQVFVEPRKAEASL
jgi:hypothetical protein